ncbi:MAG: methyltransferase domain-containing protein [Chloroflexota bacterium]
MRTQADSFGNFLMAYHQTQNASDIIERDDGFIETSIGGKAYFSTYNDWSHHVQEALSHVSGRVLDVGLGAGRHSLYLQEQGFAVVGIDASPLAIEVCRLRGVTDARLMTIEAVDNTLGHFNTILMLGNNFGLFGGYETGRNILENFHRITTPTAQIIAETLNPYTTTDQAHLTYHQWNREHKRMGGQIRFRHRYRQYCDDWMDYLFVDLSDLNQLIEGTGWQLKMTFGDTNGQYAICLSKQ